MANYPTQLDEIDQWLFDSFGIVARACNSTENLRYNTAKMIAEVLWPKSKDSLHITETCKEKGKTFTDEDADDVAYNFVMDNFGNPKESLFQFDCRCFVTGAKWQKEQMKKEAIDGHVYESSNPASVSPKVRVHAISIVYNELNSTPAIFSGDKIKFYVFRDDKEK